MIRRGPSGTMTTSWTSSEKATALGNRTACDGWRGRETYVPTWPPPEYIQKGYTLKFDLLQSHSADTPLRTPAIPLCSSRKLARQSAATASASRSGALVPLLARRSNTAAPLADGCDPRGASNPEAISARTCSHVRIQGLGRDYSFRVSGCPGVTTKMRKAGAGRRRRLNKLSCAGAKDCGGVCAGHGGVTIKVKA